MGTISGNMYRIGYRIETLAASVNDPPTSITDRVFVTVNATSDKAAIAALSTQLSINTSTQRLQILYCQQLETGAAIYN